MEPELVDELILDSILNHLNDHVYFKDRESRFVRVSNGMVKHFEVNSVDELIGKTDFDFFCDEHADVAYADEQRIIATGQPMETKIEKEVWPNKPVTWVSTSKLPWKDRDGNVIGIFGMSRDLTREQELKLKVEEQAKKLESSNRELEQFAFIASHDLQEPLRMISGFVQLIQRRYQDKLDERGRDYIRYAVEGAGRMQALIDGLLQYSRLKSTAENIKPVDCSLIFAEVVCNLQVAIKECNAQLDIQGELPVIRGVPSQIAQVFQNLLANAIKFRRPDVAPLLTISVERSEDAVEICFADNGIGIEAKYVDRIFGMFQRLHTRNEFEGNGIGLAMAKRIVNQSGGDIRVESEPGVGSRFYLTFPLIHEESNE